MDEPRWQAGICRANQGSGPLAAGRQRARDYEAATGGTCQGPMTHPSADLSPFSERRIQRWDTCWTGNCVWLGPTRQRLGGPAVVFFHRFLPSLVIVLFIHGFAQERTDPSFN